MRGDNVEQLFDFDKLEANADPDWWISAMAAINEMACRTPNFTTDDVLAEYPDLEHCRELRALGAAMRKAAKAGWVESSGTYVVSHRRRSHARPKALWNSAIVGRQPLPARAS